MDERDEGSKQERKEGRCSISKGVSFAQIIIIILIKLVPNLNYSSTPII